MENVVVLGSNSLAGSYFIDAALSAGLTVLGISRSPENPCPFSAYAGNVSIDRFTFFQADLNTEFDDIWALILDRKPMAIVDFAGQGMVAPSWEHPWQWYQTNVVAKSRLHRALVGQSWLRYYVRASTPEVYGHHDGLISSTEVMNPTTPYAVSHAAIDMNLKVYHRQYGFPSVIARFANFYGPGQKLYRIIPRAFYCAVSRTKLPLHGGGHAVRAFIHGRDVAQALLTLVDRGQYGGIYHFSTDEFLTIRELVALCGTITGTVFDDLVEITQDRPGKDKAYMMDDSETRQELGWNPEINFKSGLMDCFDWTKKHWDTISSEPLDYIHQP
ncbi:MAG: dTDP-glucose 4,6-dehydratase [Woeseia sp.]|nr:dTDP-glucose 4,6-dehydratase [Woeseia sp.]